MMEMQHATIRGTRGWPVAPVIVLIGLLVAPADGVETRPPYGEVARALEGWIAGEVESKGLPALSIALVDDQQIVWARGFGFADRARQVPAGAETVYRVGSVSKLFTDLALMQLVEQGRVELDRPVSRVLPEFAPRNPFDTPITLRQLMAHRSGLVREPPLGHYFDPKPRALLEVVQSLRETTLVARPGTHTKYSNAGVTVVGAVVERVRGERFGAAIDRALIGPHGLGLTRTSFDPGPELTRAQAEGLMWTYDGQAVATPTFALGIAPAGNLVSTVTDLGRFLSVLFADGRGPAGLIVRPETLRSMLVPQLGAGGGPTVYGIGFALSRFEGRKRIGHGGTVYGHVSQLTALPAEKIGVVVLATRDCANATVQHVSDAALRLMLAARQGQPLPALSTTKPVPHDLARRLEGRYALGKNVVDVVARPGKLWLTPLAGTLWAELRLQVEGETLMVDDCLTHGPALVPGASVITIEGREMGRIPAPKPGPAPARFAGLIGEYGWDHNVLYIREQEGTLHALIEWFFDYPLKEEGPGRFRFPKSGMYDDEAVVFTREPSGRATQVEAAGVLFPRRRLDGEDSATYRITPVRPVAELRASSLTAQPPQEAGDRRAPDLVDLAALDPTIKLDIRYATDNNFLGTPLYTSARAFLQRPAAEALVRAHQALQAHGYGLLIHDAYRPWHVTKLFWDATPDAGHAFVADPSQGSKHNRGAAVDLTLYDRATGQPVTMVGGYDEFSPRSNPDYPGGTSLQRRQRDLLRRTMEDQGFTVNTVEWWHFDFRDWAKYPILNRRFEELGVAERER
jgi:CubicO group peptidase (beta-lactamase class C family)/D-alanyl-D-alanine dipeptidase